VQRILLTALALLGAAQPAAGQPAPSPGILCRQAIESAAPAHGVPTALLAAMGRVESGRRDRTGTASHPWPWTVDAEGQGAFYDSKAEAIAAVRVLQARGVRSIDVGCMQVNLMHHPDAFGSLAQAFDPTANADYAARFLHDLFGQTGTWPKAAALYHSATPDLAAEYQRKVMAVWPEEQRLAGEGTWSKLATAWAATLNPGGFLPPRRGVGARILPMAAAADASESAGRGLDWYRSAPVMARAAALPAVKR